MKKLWQLLRGDEKRALVFVFFVLLGVSAVELLSIASIAAFVGLVSDPRGASEQNSLIQWLRSMRSDDDNQRFIIFAGVVLLCVTILRNLYVAGCTYLRLRLLHFLRRNLSARLMSSYMVEPYLFFTRSNSATLTKNITFEINNLITGNLYSWLVIISDSLVAVSIAGLLIWSSPGIALIAISVLGVICGVMLIAMRRHVQSLGATHRHWNGLVYKFTNEAIGGVKEIKILGRENYFVDRLYHAADGLARAAIQHGFLQEVPRAMLEIVVFASILAIAVIGTGQEIGLAGVAGILALFAAALYRLMPIATRIVSSVNGLFFNQAILNDLVETFDRGSGKVQLINEDQEPLKFDNKIKLENVSFTYPESPTTTIDGLSLEIERNRSVAFVGPSGVGKSTLIDLLLGLVEPADGRFLVDDTEICDSNRRSWQANIGFVPQEIFLTDGSIRENIAFGLQPDQINEEQLVSAANAADLHRFVSELPDGYDSIVGERGLRLSGGQRQRVGIARALYRGAKLLVLDEATSALDGITEAVVQQAIRDLSGQLTIIIIAHRLQSVQHCDMIHLMEGGQVVASGTYAELMKENETFRAMARSASE